MKTSFVAHLALAALVVTGLGPTLTAQDDGSRAPRPRPEAEDEAEVQRPRGRALDRLTRSQPPRLGVYIDTTDDGLLVSQVEEGSLADQAGVLPGDLLLRLGRRNLDEAGDIRAALAAARPGQTLDLGVVREGQGLVKLEVKIPEPEVTGDQAPRRRGLGDGSQGGFLGVQLGDATDDGITIAEVIDGTSAWFAGLEAGDLLRSIDGHALNGPEDVVGAVSSRKPGSMITLAYSRDGEGHTATVRLGSRMRPTSMAFPGGNMAFPHVFGTPDGNVMTLNPGWARNVPRVFRFFDEDGRGGFTFNDRDLQEFDWEDFHGRWQDSMDDWREQLHEQLQDLDIDIRDGADIRIQIEDGVMTIDQDGETKVIELDDQEAIEEALENVRMHGVHLFPGMGRQGSGLPQGSVQFHTDSDVPRRLLRLGDDLFLNMGDAACQVECDVRVECDEDESDDQDTTDVL